MDWNGKAKDRGITSFDVCSNQKFSSPFVVVQLADTQYGMMIEGKEANDYKKEIELTERAITYINNTKPLFCIICGDLINKPPSKIDGETDSLWKEQVDVFFETWKKLDQTIPLVCTCGNHDLGNVPNSISLKQYKQHFGDDYFAFWAGGCRWIVLNSVLFVMSMEAEVESKQQIEWLENELNYLKENPATHTFILMHHPLFLSEPEEADQYYSPTSPINFPGPIRQQLIKKFTEAKVSAVLAGHYHRNAYGKFGDIEMITTSAVCVPLGQDPPGFRIVTVNEHSFSHEYRQISEL